MPRLAVPYIMAVAAVWQCPAVDALRSSPQHLLEEVMTAEKAVAQGASSRREFTRLRFKLPVSESSSLVEVTKECPDPGPDLGRMRSADWDLELEAYHAEPAVREMWRHTTIVKDYSGTKQAGLVDEIRGRCVPGLYDVSFGQVFAALQDAGCPLWMIGGAARDLVAGRGPNDIDCGALCNTAIIRRVAADNGWKHHTGSGAYFSIGTAHGDDPEYLEGFSLDLVFSDVFTPEWSVNSLLWSLSQNRVIDPSGFGIQDATHTYKGRSQPLLRPGIPKLEEFAQGTEQWSLYRRWMTASFSRPDLQRHVRYLKMRARGWRPVNDCVRFFMGNQFVVASQIENLDTRDRQIEWPEGSGEQHPNTPGALMQWIVDEVDHADKKGGDADKAIKNIIKQMRWDTDAYLHNMKRGQCTSAGIIAKDVMRDPPRYFSNVLRDGLLDQCRHPSYAIEDFVNQTQSRDNFNRACRSIQDIHDCLVSGKGNKCVDNSR